MTGLRATLLAALADLEADIDAARESGKAWTAVGGMHAMRVKLLKELAAIPDEEETAEPTLEEEIAAAVDYVGAMDERVLVAVETAIARRRAEGYVVLVQERR